MQCNFVICGHLHGFIARKLPNSVTLLEYRNCNWAAYQKTEIDPWLTPLRYNGRKAAASIQLRLVASSDLEIQEREREGEREKRRTRRRWFAAAGIENNGASAFPSLFCCSSLYRVAHKPDVFIIWHSVDRNAEKLHAIILQIHLHDGTPCVTLMVVWEGRNRPWPSSCSAWWFNCILDPTYRWKYFPLKWTCRHGYTFICQNELEFGPPLMSQMTQVWPPQLTFCMYFVYVNPEWTWCKGNYLIELGVYSTKRKVKMCWCMHYIMLL